MNGPKMRFRAKDAEGLVIVDRVAFHDRKVMALSIAAPTVQAKAVAALLGSGLTVLLEFEDVPWPAWGEGRNRNFYGVKKPDGGMRVYRTRLNRWMGHVVAIAKDERLLLDRGTDGILNRLLSSEFTTPILPEWAGPIENRLRADNKLVDCDGYNLNAAMLGCDDEALDGIVSDLVRKGTCKIEETLP